MSFYPSSLILLGSRWTLTDSLKGFSWPRWQPWKCFRQPQQLPLPCAQPSTAPPFFNFLFFLRFEENKSGASPRGKPQPRIYLPAIRDHKSLWWMELLPSVVQGFDGAAGGVDLRAGLQQKKGPSWKKRQPGDGSLNKCFSPLCSPSYSGKSCWMRAAVKGCLIESLAWRYWRVPTLL